MRMGDPVHQPATYEDLRDVPEHLVAELLAGELHTQPRPTLVHARAASRLNRKLGPFDEDDGDGPGGWIILMEPELHLGADVLVPDVAGWRRETMPELPQVGHADTRPDWLCEVLSPSTAAHDRVRKLPIYAVRGVPHVWLLDPERRTLEVMRLDGDTYRAIGTHADTDRVRAEPFEAIELDLQILWQR